MENRSDISRRKALLYGALIPITVSQSGCLHIFLRLLVGRGAARMLVRAAGGGVRGAGMTFGRGVSVGSMAARQATLRGATSSSTIVPAGSRIIRPDGRTVARTQRSKDGRGTYTRVDGSDILYSEETPYGHEHDLGRIVAGRSYRRKKGIVEHKDNRGRTMGYDEVRLAQRVIRHLDNNEKVIGETKFSSTQDEIILNADNNTIESFEAIVKEYGLDCPESKAAYDEYTRYQEACLDSTGPCGGGSTLRLDRWKALKSQCHANRINQ